MPIYVYETVDSRKPKRFEIQQSMKDAPLTVHPETGEPVKRVISGGYGMIQKAGAAASSKPAGGGGHSCGMGGCGCHH